MNEKCVGRLLMKPLADSMRIVMMRNIARLVAPAGFGRGHSFEPMLMR